MWRPLTGYDDEDVEKLSNYDLSPLVELFNSYIDPLFEQYDRTEHPWKACPEKYSDWGEKSLKEQYDIMLEDGDISTEDIRDMGKKLAREVAKAVKPVTELDERNGYNMYVYRTLAIPFIDRVDARDRFTSDLGPISFGVYVNEEEMVRMFEDMLNEVKRNPEQ